MRQGFTTTTPNTATTTTVTTNTTVFDSANTTTTTKDTKDPNEATMKSKVVVFFSGFWVFLAVFLVIFDCF